MITDALNTFADNVALNTGAAGTYYVGDVIDLKSIGRNIGQHGGVDGLFLVLKVTTTATGATATGQFALVTDDNSSLTSPTVIPGTQTAAIPVATLVANYVIAVIPLPISSLYERYLAIQQITGTAAFTAGKIDAFLTPTPPDPATYADGLASGS